MHNLERTYTQQVCLGPKGYTLLLYGAWYWPRAPPRDLS